VTLEDGQLCTFPDHRFGRPTRHDFDAFFPRQPDLEYSSWGSSFHQHQHTRLDTSLTVNAYYLYRSSYLSFSSRSIDESVFQHTYNYNRRVRSLPNKHYRSFYIPTNSDV